MKSSDPSTKRSCHFRILQSLKEWERIQCLSFPRSWFWACACPLSSAVIPGGKLLWWEMYAEGMRFLAQGPIRPGFCGPDNLSILFKSRDLSVFMEHREISPKVTLKIVVWLLHTALWYGLSPASQEGIHTWYWKSRQKPMAEVTGPSGKLLLLLAKWTCWAHQVAL